MRKCLVSTWIELGMKFHCLFLGEIRSQWLCKERKGISGKSHNQANKLTYMCSSRVKFLIQRENLCGVAARLALCEFIILSILWEWIGRKPAKQTTKTRSQSLVSFSRWNCPLGKDDLMSSRLGGRCLVAVSLPDWGHWLDTVCPCTRTHVVGQDPQGRGQSSGMGWGGVGEAVVPVGLEQGSDGATPPRLSSELTLKVDGWRTLCSCAVLLFSF